MTVQTTPMIQAVDVWKSFGQLDVLKGINLEVMPGSVTCLIGPSGSGKSTFLRCVNHLEKVNAGRLYVDGDLIGYRERGGVLYEMSEKDAAKQRRDIGMVFQNFNLFGHRTVLENIIDKMRAIVDKHVPRLPGAPEATWRCAITEMVDNGFPAVGQEFLPVFAPHMGQEERNILIEKVKALYRPLLHRGEKVRAVPRRPRRPRLPFRHHHTVAAAANHRRRGVRP